MVGHCARTPVIAALFLFSVFPALALDVPPPPAPKGADAVNVGWMVFVPATLTTTVGATVTWTNVDDSNHMIKFPDQAGPRMDRGSTYSRSFPTPGTYTYQCGIHGARMTGTVVVR